jgi:hypothetical protein
MSPDRAASSNALVGGGSVPRRLHRDESPLVSVMIKFPVTIRFEQAVYGSFPFWQRGYSVLAHSAGCRPEWLAELRTVCQRLGDPPAGAGDADSLFALRLRCGPWMIVGAYPLGRDDHDRPGALAFHALFFGNWAYRWAGADPFTFTQALRRDWCAADRDRILPTGSRDLRENESKTAPNSTADDVRLPLIVAALTRGRRVIVQSSEPITGLARSVWHALPRSVRRSATVATWAFDNANRFDLIGTPKLAGVEQDSADLILGLEHALR